MTRVLIALLLLLPLGAYAQAPYGARNPSSFLAGRSLIVATPAPGNAYLAGISVVNTAPVAGDLLAAAGSIVSAAPVRGDVSLLAGTVSSRAAIIGDLHALGGGINIEGPVAGDLVAAGYSVQNFERTQGSTFIVAADASVSEGAVGPVIIYGNNISLAGDFADNVTIFAAGRLTLAASTTIRGSLSYEAPEEASIPASATIEGGVTYKNATYLPDAGISRILALVSIGFFLFVRILGALILAGLLAGLFPKLAEALTDHLLQKRVRSALLTTLLGFGILVATPVLIMLLTLTFVGIGLAALLLILYALLVLLAFLYAGILLGSLLARRIRKRENVVWHDGIVGMLVLSLIGLVPGVGFLVVLTASLFTAGALLLILFRFAFPHEESTNELL